MKRTTSLAALGLQACLETAPVDGPPEPSQLCRRAFLEVLDAWETHVGDVPRECRNVDARYAIVFVDREADMPCTADQPGVIVGCHRADSETIYILRRDNVAMVDTAVHEWIHALSLCATGDEQGGHTDPRLWLERSGSTVEGTAIVELGAGRCE